MTSETVDVIVSGAGPVGLLLAYDLAKKGHSVAIMDPKPGPTNQSRALLITSRTMEILDGKGLASEVLREAFITNGMRMIRNGSVLGEISAGGDTSFPYMVGLMQGKTEHIIHKRMEKETDCRVQWESELVTYTQDDQGVTAIVKNNKTGEEYTITAKYIVGADGSHSRVRKENPKWTYEGVAIKTRFLIADVSLDGDNIEEFSRKMNAFSSGNKVLGLVRIRPMVHNDDDSHVFRVFGNLESYEKTGVNQNSSTHGISAKGEQLAPSLEQVQDLLDERTTPYKFKARDLIWSSHFKINERIANGYRRKRAFLAGDAAHCHSPAGGQGMNLGLQDADNLAWKLSAVLNGHVTNIEKLLDSYSTEREPHARKTIETTSSVTSTGLKEGFLVDFTRQCVMTTALAVPQLREYLYKTITQQSLAILPESSKILGTSDKGLIKVGEFFPDTVPLRKRFIPLGESLIERRTFRSFLLNNHRFTLVLVNTSHSTNLPNEKIAKEFWTKSRSYPVRRIVIQSPWHTHTASKPDYVTKDEVQDADNGFYIEERIEDPISVSSRSGLLPLLSKYLNNDSQPSVLLMLRPDMYVTHARIIHNEADLESAYEYVDSVFN
ncbi:hypothetical protein K501DRAFT_242649 [Backusella circina FSU 941]|nr:hypothetical protein K501DRAFT_242649 [Backusella circina FSU 941]